MGYFSWITSDTDESIAARRSERPTKTVYLLSPDGKHLREDDYEGFGVFGGTDAFVWWMRHNKPEECGDSTAEEIRRMFFANGSKIYHETNGGRENCEFPIKLASKPADYDSVDASVACPEQGYFYDNLIEKIFGGAN